MSLYSSSGIYLDEFEQIFVKRYLTQLANAFLKSAK